jgi:Spy/CpxP family protein refolding chaperone
VKSHWVLAILIITSTVTIPAGAQANNRPLAADEGLPQQHLNLSPGPSVQSQLPPVQEAGGYPARLEEVLSAMSAELDQIGQAARQGLITRDQAEYLSFERYYVALTRFQLLRSLYQAPAENNPTLPNAQANETSLAASNGLILPPLTCSPDIPEQLAVYLELTPAEIQAIEAQVSKECQRVQPLMQRLEKSRRDMLAKKMNGKIDERGLRASAAEQSQIVKQLIVMNSELETKLYSLLTTEQQRKVDGLLRQTLDSGQMMLSPQQ